jgi:hypothetical protein
MHDSDTDESAEPSPSALPVAVPPAGMLDVLHANFESAASYKEAARSTATLRAHVSDWRIYEQWCAARGLEPMPAHPEQIGAFASNQADAGGEVVDDRAQGCRHRPLSSRQPLSGAVRSPASGWTSRDARRYPPLSASQEDPKDRGRRLSVARHAC